ncbi:MAG: hydroxymethylbilane synthase [Gemmatimonadaceae bacterium]
MAGNADVIRIATRASELALRQARQVEAALAARGVSAELVKVKTSGDKRIDEPLSGIGAKGLFTRELENALRAGKVDCCVHSLKDLPTEQPDSLVIAAILEREDPRDALIVNDSLGVNAIDELPRGSRVGTSSLRRRALLLARRSDLEVVDLRGNVPTRLRKVDDGQVHATILAVAGLNRLGVHQRVDEVLEPPEWLPAAGQGAIAVQARGDDSRMLEMLASLEHAPTALAVRAERGCLEAMEGGCQVPIGVLAMTEPNGLVLHAFIADPRGTHVVRGHAPVDPENPEGSGRRVAYDILSRGGRYVLERLRGESKVPVPAPE